MHREEGTGIRPSRQQLQTDTTVHGRTLIAERPSQFTRPLRQIEPWSGGLIAAIVGVAVSAGYLLSPPMGRDLSAQVAHTQLAQQHWPALLDLRWYGGFDPLGYSILSPPVMALVGVRLTTALGYLASVVLFAALLRRTRVAHPTIGAVVGAVCLAGNLVTGRTTFVLGLTAGLGALLALTWKRLGVSSALAVLTPLFSPVAGLFLGICGAALFLSGQRRSGATVAVASLVPTVAVGLAFGNGGRQSFADEHALAGFVVCLAVAALSWRRLQVRWGALLAAALVAAAYLLPTPVGTNAIRLPELFAVPTIVAVVTLPVAAVAAITAALVWFLPPVSLDEVRDRGDPALDQRFYAPLLEQLEVRGIDGPIEVVPTRRRGEVAAVALTVPIARGWLRQVDIDRNPVFYDGTLDADTYRKWLDDNAVSHVAISDGPHDWAAPDEADLARAGLPYLEPVWSNGTWVLYSVSEAQPVVSPPARVVARDPVSLTVAVPEPGEYEVKVRWSRYLSASAGCLRPTADGWSVIVAERPGSIKIGGSLLPRQCDS
jgi:hypothetical protein